ncbi:MAG: hypothetical protein EXR75_05190 [Myxococcales bacterium]|nr:hypothetical protein [Myxococcales bacterium]
MSHQRRARTERQSQATLRRLATASCFVLQACTGAEDTSPCPAAERASHTLRYRLAWDDGPSSLSQDPAEPRPPRTFVNDLGYHVTVERGELANYSAQLVPCTAEQLAALTVTGDSCPSALTPLAAPLGHSGDLDPSALDTVVVESLLGDGLEYGIALAEGARYCRAHYLAGPVTNTTDGGILGLTLWLEGSYRAPGSTTDVPLSIGTKSAFGAFLALTHQGSPAPMAYDSGLASAELTVTRPRRAMFDGLALSSASPDDASLAVLRQLIKFARVDVAP